MFCFLYIVFYILYLYFVSCHSHCVSKYINIRGMCTVTDKKVYAIMDDLTDAMTSEMT